MYFHNYIVLLLHVFFLSCQTKDLPNIVVFLADDLGIGDIGAFGNTTIKTPNINCMAESGAILSHHIAAAAVCTPSRAALLTGRYPVRMGMESSGRNKVFFFVASSGGLPENETTIASVLKDKGYSTSVIGKWHLGTNRQEMGDLSHHPLRHGFQSFYGLPLSNFKDLGSDGQSVITAYSRNFFRIYIAVIIVSLTTVIILRIIKQKTLSLLFFIVTVIIPCIILGFLMNLKILNGVIMRNATVVEQPVRLPGLTQRFVVEAKEFIRRNAETKTPFFLYFPFVHVHTALFTSKNFPKINVHGEYGRNVEELDWAVGEIMNLLKNLGIIEDTFVYFSSDNGAHVEEYGKMGQREGGYNGIYKGGKTIAGYEGGIRVPTVVHWLGRIPVHSKIDVMTSQMDLFPTIMEIINEKMPEDRIYDGKSLIPLLTGQSQRSPHEILFHYCGKMLHAATYVPRTGKDIWKLHWYSPKFEPGTTSCGFVCHCYGKFVVRHKTPLLYNLFKDPSESNPITRISIISEYKKIIDHMNLHRELHQKQITTVPDQFSFSNTMWKPWLQPCCHFPLCHCKDKKHKYIV